MVETLVRSNRDAESRGVVRKEKGYKKTASTAPLFCSDHDEWLFKVVDQGVLPTEDRLREYILMQCYRATVYEIYKVRREMVLASNPEVRRSELALFHRRYVAGRGLSKAGQIQMHVEHAIDRINRLELTRQQKMRFLAEQKRLLEQCFYASPEDRSVVVTEKSWGPLKEAVIINADKMNFFMAGSPCLFGSRLKGLAPPSPVFPVVAKYLGAPLRGYAIAFFDLKRFPTLCAPQLNSSCYEATVNGFAQRLVSMEDNEPSRTARVGLLTTFFFMECKNLYFSASWYDGITEDERALINEAAWYRSLEQNCFLANFQDDTSKIMVKGLSKSMGWSIKGLMRVPPV